MQRLQAQRIRLAVEGLLNSQEPVGQNLVLKRRGVEELDIGCKLGVGQCRLAMGQKKPDKNDEQVSHFEMN